MVPEKAPEAGLAIQSHFDLVDHAGSDIVLIEARSIIISIQTFHLSINLIDLYLSKTNTQVLRKNLQAIGSVCMYIASKILEQ